MAKETAESSSTQATGEAGNPVPDKAQAAPPDTSTTLTQEPTKETGKVAEAKPATEDGKPPADQQKQEGTKKEDAKADLQLKFPEGFVPDDALVGKFKDIAKESGLKAEKAQAVVDLFLEHQKASEERAQADLTKIYASWKDSLPKDKEFGGADWKANNAIALKAVTKFATPEFRKILTETRLGDHPEFVRLFYRIGKAIAEDSVATQTAGKATKRPTTDEEVAAALFPSMNPS